jgi:hypothetical protein
MISTSHTNPTGPTDLTTTIHTHTHAHTHAHTHVHTFSPQPLPVLSWSPIYVALLRAGNGGASLSQHHQLVAVASPHSRYYVSHVHSFHTFMTSSSSSCSYQHHTLRHHQTIIPSTSTDHTIITSYLGSTTALLHCTAMMTSTQFHS